MLQKKHQVGKTRAASAEDKGTQTKQEQHEEDKSRGEKIHESVKANATVKRHEAHLGWVEGTWTTGYWDCCKPSCSWPGKGHVDKPVLACDSNTGEELYDANTPSVCGGGTAGSCASNKPFMVRPGLSMGFAAAAVSGTSGLTGDANCGQCYELVFTDQSHDGGWGGAHPSIRGKSLVVQVTNIGYDVTGTHSFDIQIPGAGEGLFTDGCPVQYQGFSSEDFDCANHYGGCTDKSGCSRLPQALRDGCHWRHDWYRWLESDGTTNNPFVKFRRVQCPRQLTEITKSTPLDDADFPALVLDDYN